MQKIRWGILSTANIAQQRLIPAINSSESGVVYAIASRNPEKAEHVAQEFGIPNAFSCYEDLLNSPEVDAVYCPLPTGMHREWCLKSLEAGKPMLCEKPLTVQASEAKEVLDAFEREDLLISEAYMYRYHPLNHKVRELISRGEIGDLRSIQATFNVNISRSDIRFSKELGGGSILDLGCYCIGIARFLTGEEPVKGYSIAHIGKESEVDETRVGILEFPNHVLSNFSCSLTSQFECCYEVFGSKGRIRVQKGGMIPWPGEDFDIELWKDDSFERITVPEEDHYRILVEEFNQALIQGKKEVVSHQESLRNLAVMDMLRATD